MKLFTTSSMGFRVAILRSAGFFLLFSVSVLYCASIQANDAIHPLSLEILIQKCMARKTGILQKLKLSSGKMHPKALEILTQYRKDANEYFLVSKLAKALQELPERHSRPFTEIEDDIRTVQLALKNQKILPEDLISARDAARLVILGVSANYLGYQIGNENILKDYYLMMLRGYALALNRQILLTQEFPNLKALDWRRLQRALIEREFGNETDLEEILRPQLSTDAELQIASQNPAWNQIPNALAWGEYIEGLQAQIQALELSQKAEVAKSADKKTEPATTGNFVAPLYLNGSSAYLGIREKDFSVRITKATSELLKVSLPADAGALNLQDYSKLEKPSLQDLRRLAEYAKNETEKFWQELRKQKRVKPEVSVAALANLPALQAELKKSLESNKSNLEQRQAIYWINEWTWMEPKFAETLAGVLVSNLANKRKEEDLEYLLYILLATKARQDFSAHDFTIAEDALVSLAPKDQWVESLRLAYLHATTDELKDLVVNVAYKYRVQQDLAVAIDSQNAFAEGGLSYGSSYQQHLDSNSFRRPAQEFNERMERRAEALERALVAFGSANVQTTSTKTQAPQARTRTDQDKAQNLDFSTVKEFFHHWKLSPDELALGLQSYLQIKASDRKTYHLRFLFEEMNTRPKDFLDYFFKQQSIPSEIYMAAISAGSEFIDALVEASRKDAPENRLKALRMLALIALIDRGRSFDYASDILKLLPSLHEEALEMGLMIVLSSLQSKDLNCSETDVEVTYDDRDLIASEEDWIQAVAESWKNADSDHLKDLIALMAYKFRLRYELPGKEPELAAQIEERYENMPRVRDSVTSFESYADMVMRKSENAYLGLPIE